jgi:hypothetical protein
MEKMMIALLAIGLMFAANLLILLARSKTRGFVRMLLSLAAYAALGCAGLFMLIVLFSM